MKLFLAVPRQPRTSDTQTVTSPARTRESVARLPLLDTRESLVQILGSLHGTNRTSLKVAQRLKLLDMHRSPLRVIRGQVESRFSKGAVPLSQEDLTVAGLFRDCCVEMAFGYKIIVLEVAQSRKRRYLVEMRLSMARALFYLEQTVFACALFRQIPPEGIWQEIHTIYFYARTLGVAEDPLKDPVSKVRTSTSISLTYRRTLLFGLSDPFHQSVPLMCRVLEFLRRHAQEAQLRKYTRPPKGYCQFLIDPQSDHPARAYLKDDKTKPPKNVLLLDTFNLTQHARHLLKRLKSAEQVDIELDEEFQDDLGRKLLEEVVYKWGLVLTREEERREEEASHIDIVSGIEAVNYYLNGEQPLAFSVADEANDGSTSTHELRPRQSQVIKQACRILDRGESGLRVTIPYQDAGVGSLRVGDVVAVSEDGVAWTTGLTRWMRCIDDSIQFGIKCLKGRVRPVAIKPVSTEREDAFKAGLLLTGDGKDDTVIQLITPPGLYRFQRNLFLDDGESLLMTRSRSLLESTQTMEWFECELLNL